ncbi:MAG: RDD family protein [Armatimonadetes bacterium]|nr:RDD family protein [Armatimonadota bacterium]MDW8152801.1 hypothetical protein [Armatimonadota bacterium]
MEPWVWLLLALLLADLAVLAWIVRRARTLRQARRHEYQVWRAALDADPWRLRLYHAHWKARWRAGVASLVGILLCLAVTWGALLLAGPRVGFNPWDGVSDAESFTVVLVWVLCYLLVVFGGFRLTGTTPGLHLLGIAVLSPHTGRPAERSGMRPPTKWDYRRDRVPELLFVPKGELRGWERAASNREGR